MTTDLPRIPEVIDIVPDLDPTSQTGETEDSVADAAQDVSPTRNPFLLLLGIIAIALIVVGIWLFVSSGQAFNSSVVPAQGDYMSLDAAIHTAPFIAMLGAATAIGVLFVFAARYRRRP